MTVVSLSLLVGSIASCSKTLCVIVGVEGVVFLMVDVTIITDINSNSWS